MTATKLLWGPATIGNINTLTAALSSTNLNDADNAGAWIFNVPKDGSITDIGVLITTETGTSPQYNCKLVTLDSSGRPTTTDYGGSTGTPTTWTSTGWKWVTLAGAATGAAGDFAAVHIYPTGSTPDASNFVAVPTQGISTGRGFNLHFTTAWTVQTSGCAGFAIKYSGGEVYGFALASNTVHVSVRSNTTPDEVGNLFQVPAPMVCYGARVYHAVAGIGSSGAYDVIIYNASGSSVASATISDKDYIDDVPYIDVFWDGLTLDANTNYRLILKPTVAATGDIVTPKWTFESTAALASIPEGNRWQYTSRTDAGSWTDDNVSVCPMGLWISDITFVQGSGTAGAEWGFVG